MSDRESDGFFPDGDMGKRSEPTSHHTGTLPPNSGQTGQDSGSSESSNDGSSGGDDSSEQGGNKS